MATHPVPVAAEPRHEHVDPYLWRTTPNPQKMRLIEHWAVGSVAADVGCGAGVYARALAERGMNVSAVDPGENPFEAGTAVRFVQASAPPLPLGDRSCDTVLLFDVLEHAENEDALLREVRRVCRGRVLLSVPARGDGPLPAYGICLVHHVDPTHQRTYDSESLRGSLERNGFRLVHAEPSFPSALPFVVTEFFRDSWFGRAARVATALWLRVLLECRLLRVDLPGDWLAVAEPDTSQAEAARA